ncbi:hypothetical protein JAAARDRAFT_471056 [Jaapia argillacea MUCL 33604]|uniref:Uncharacterized protein n=1 Tax=Jaapia argillacea MUCL 33604 TaxID=933084 RepID=A0A067Q725_9AGAM|nr:hypothetical protein JAAARDRAFT_471056 [Jaapia argillacea MUCL 33604]
MGSNMALACTHCPIHCINSLRVHPVSLVDFDSQIAHLEQTLSFLKRNRNARLSIFRLPPEILCEIFISCITEFSAPNPLLRKGPIHPKPFLQKLFELTHICRDLRKVLLQCPSHWRRIVRSPKDCVEELLARSSSVPIEVDFSSPEKMLRRDEENLALLMDHGGRIRTFISPLDFRTYSETEFQLLTSESMELQLCRSTPLLERIKLTAPIPGIRLPLRRLLGGDTPALRHIGFDGIFIDWTAPILRNLTSLTIGPTDSQYSLQTAGDFPHMLSALENMPSLQVLSLTAALPPGHSNATTLRQISLPALAALHVMDEVGRCANFLDCLVLTAASSIEVRTIDVPRYSINIVEIPHLLRALQSRLHDPPALIPILAIEFDVASGPVTVHAGLTEDGETQKTNGQLPRLLLDIPRCSISQWVPQLLDILPLSDVCVTVIYRAGHLTVEQGHQLFDGLVNVRVCQVIGPISPALVTLLSTCFPRLERLCFHKTDFSHPNRRRNYGGPAPRPLTDILASSLVERRNTIGKLEELKLKSCPGLNQEIVDSYGDSVVGTVEWDDE